MYYNIHSYTKGTPPFQVYILYILVQVPMRLPTYVVASRTKPTRIFHISLFFILVLLCCIPIVCSAHAEYSFDALKPLEPDRNRLSILF